MTGVLQQTSEHYQTADALSSNSRAKCLMQSMLTWNYTREGDLEGEIARLMTQSKHRKNDRLQ